MIVLGTKLQGFQKRTVHVLTQLNYYLKISYFCCHYGRNSDSQCNDHKFENGVLAFTLRTLSNPLPTKKPETVLSLRMFHISFLSSNHHAVFCHLKLSGSRLIRKNNLQIL